MQLALLVKSPTGDVVGVVETVAVQFAGLRLFCRGALLLFSGLAERVSTPLPGVVPTARLGSRGNHSFCHSMCTHDKLTAFVNVLITHPQFSYLKGSAVEFEAFH